MDSGKCRVCIRPEYRDRVDPLKGCTCEYVKCERIRIGRCPVHPNNRKGRVDVLMAQVPVAKQMLGEGDTR